MAALFYFLQSFSDRLFQQTSRSVFAQTVTQQTAGVDELPATASPGDDEPDDSDDPSPTGDGSPAPGGPTGQPDVDCSDPNADGFSTYCVQDPLEGSGNTVYTLIERIVTGLTNILIPLSVIMIIYAGLQFIIARGNESKLQDAKKVLTNVLIGVTIIVGARVFVEIIKAVRETL